MNQPSSDLAALPNASGHAGGHTPSVSPSLPVGDVLIRRQDAGYGIFNYRGERVLDLPVRTSAEAARLAAEIVSPWHGHVRIDDSSVES